MVFHGKLIVIDKIFYKYSLHLIIANNEQDFEIKG